MLNGFVGNKILSLGLWQDVKVPLRKWQHFLSTTGGMDRLPLDKIHPEKNSLWHFLNWIKSSSQNTLECYINCSPKNYTHFNPTFDMVQLAVKNSWHHKIFSWCHEAGVWNREEEIILLHKPPNGINFFVPCRDIRNFMTSPKNFMMSRLWNLMIFMTL